MSTRSGTTRFGFILSNYSGSVCYPSYFSRRYIINYKFEHFKVRIFPYIRYLSCQKVWILFWILIQIGPESTTQYNSLNIFFIPGSVTPSSTTPHPFLQMVTFKDNNYITQRRGSILAWIVILYIFGADTIAIGLSFSALISWFMKSIIRIINNSNLHAIISTL